MKTQSALGVSNETSAHVYMSPNYTQDYSNRAAAGSYGKVMYEDLGPCGNEPECTIGIYLQQDYYNYLLLGSVTVDVNNKLKIINMNVYEPYIIKISQMEYFNNIEIKPSDLSPPPNPWIEVFNFINSSVVASIQDVIVIDEPILPHEEGKVFFEATYEECNNMAQCTIDLQTSQGGMIGSIIVDMENDMNILQVSSFRPSEIVITQTGANVIEIKYPYLSDK